MDTSDETIQMFVSSKMPWIRRQQRKFLQQDRETRREYVTGESHYFLGRRYLLDVNLTETTPGVEIRRNTHINLNVRPGMESRQRGAVLEAFYRRELKKLVPGRVSRWGNRLGVEVNEVRIKKMKTKWGSCNAENRRIWLNLELAKAPSRCIDYVIIHEMIHLLEPRHSKRFAEILRSVCPNFEQDKAILSAGPLGYFEWKC